MILSNFSRALERYKTELDDSSYWRYRGGRLPKILTWLASRPELAAALAEDARQIAAEPSKEGAENEARPGY